MRIFQENKNSKAQSCWVSILDGDITASGAPSKKRLKSWPESSVTDIVTLLRCNEMQSWLPIACKNFGINWHHFPLSGRNLSMPEDIATLCRISEVVSLLESPRRIVVHCAAGMHRTGVFLYFLMRNAGIDENKILELIEEIRPVTAEELSKKTAKGILLDKAKTLYQENLI